MPQPLSRVNPSAALFISNDAFVDHPSFCVLLAAIVEQSSHVDSWLGGILARLLGASAEVGIAMYASLSGANAQRAALHAVAQMKLTGDDLDLFSAVMRITQRARKQRNAVVHGVWATSPDIPDALIMIPSKDYLEQTAKIAAANARLQTKDEIAPLDLNNVLVYKERDFVEIQDNVRASLANLQALFLWFCEPSALSRKRLWSEPDVQSEIARIQKDRQNNQEARQ